MSTKTIMYLGVVVGSTLGGLIPNLWGAGFLSFSGVIFSAIGGVAGIWVGYQLSR